MGALGDISSGIGTVAKNYLTQDGQTERFTFKKFDGALLRQSVANGSTYPENMIETVVLKINPEQIENQQPRLTQKVQTNSPNRFVVFDWGVDLRTMSIKGNTGNLLPESILGGNDPLRPFADYWKTKMGQGDSEALTVKGDTKNFLNFVGASMLANMSYFELLQMSPKYRTFVRLQNLYLKFDADRDVGVLEFGEFIYRIYFLDFTFTQEAASPWNWKYDIQVNVLSDLTEFSRKGDAKINNNRNVDRTQ